MEKELAAVFDCISEGIVYKEASGRIRLFNKAAEEILGLSREQALGLTSQNHDWVMLHEDGSPCPGDEHPPMVTLRTGQALSDQVRGLPRPGGGVTWLSINTRPVFEPGQDQPSGVVISFRDIGQRKRAEEELRLSQERLSLAMEAARSGVWEWDLASNRTVWSEELWTLFGLKPHSLECSYGVWLETVHPDDRAQVEKAAQEAIGNGTEVNVEWRVIRPDHKELWLMSRGLPRFDEHGKPKSYFGIVLDVTERKRAEEELRLNQSRLRVALATVDLAVFHQDRDLRYTWMYKPQLGYDAGQAVGRTDADLLPAQDAAVVMDLKRGVVASGRGARQEVGVSTPEGTLTFDLVVEPLLEEDGSVVGITGSSLNITQRKRTEQELRQSEEKFRLAFQLSPLAMTITRLSDGEIKLVNEAHQKIFGNVPRDIQGRTTAELGVWVYPDDRRRLVEEVTAHGFCRDFRTAIRNKDGESLTISLNCTLVDYAGERCILSVLQDLTQSLKAEEEHRQWEAHLRQAHKMQAVGTLAGGMAHEFNNLLAVIMGYAELVRDEAQGRRDILEDLAPILDACQRGRDLIRQLAAFSRREEPQATPLNLNQQITATREMLARLLPRAVAMETDLDPGLPTTGMAVGHFQQVLVALANNAAQAMPAGGRLGIKTAGVTLEPTVCAACGEAFAGDFALLAVRDSGQGMDPETMARIFEPFFSTKGVGAGAGLGLSVAQAIVKSYGGHILCRSSLGQGTCLEVYLPVYRMDEGAAVWKEPRPAEAPGGRETILLVDDEEALRDLGRRLLGQAGYTVLTAQNGEEALRIFQEDPAAIALVLLDLGMPGMGGQRCLQEILALAPPAKVVVASGYTSGGQDEQALAAGAQAFVAKPFRKAELLGVIREVLDRGASA